MIDDTLTDVTIVDISNRVEQQFPAFYRQYGPGFVEFVRAYYQWLSDQGGIIEQSRTLIDKFDVDKTPDEFLRHFQAKYMANLPVELLGNQRFLQKHIVELYRSKGSQHGIRLLFRLLFNEDIDVYIPSYDIFKLSDNTWVQPKYFEITRVQYAADMVNRFVTGSVSGATALVESYQQKYINDRIVNLLLVSNISGHFIPNENIIDGIINPIDAPIIKGSVVELSVIGSTTGFKVGDQAVGSVGDKPIKATVSEVYTGTGQLNITLVEGGDYYSLDAEIIFSQGANTSGFGAQAIVNSIDDTFLYQYNSDKLLPYANVALNALAYGFPADPAANAESIIEDCLQFDLIEVGTISSILILNPGDNYDDYVTVQAIDPYTSTKGIFLEDGTIVGTNAIITGIPLFGDNLIRSVRVESSGYAMQEIDLFAFTSTANNQLTFSATPIFGGIGFDAGYYQNTKSFLSDDKYLFDGHYYQNYSYVIKASQTLDKYIEVLRQTVHPAGNAVYGDINIKAYNKITNAITSAEVKVI